MGNSQHSCLSKRPRGHKPAPPVSIVSSSASYRTHERIIGVVLFTELGELSLLRAPENSNIISATRTQGIQYSQRGRNGTGPWQQAAEGTGEGSEARGTRYDPL